MQKLESYANKYQTIQMSRTDGILEVKLHTNGGPLHWSLLPHGELTRAFHEIGQDYDNEVIILTGTGAAFSGPALGPNGHNHVSHPVTAMEWDKIYFEGKHLLLNLLNIEVPIIAAINGPTLRHAEIPLLSDIVLAADTATFQDSAHFWGGLVPGDGVHVVFPHLMGTNRGRYFLLTGQTINAQEAKEVGLVNEVLPLDQLLPRAWELARYLKMRSPLLRRYSRVLATQELKKKILDLHGYGLALEGLAATHNSNQSGQE